MLVSAFPQSDKIDVAIRTVLRDSARDVGDEQIADRIKKNADYGNALGHLVSRNHVFNRPELYQLADIKGQATPWHFPN